MVVILTPYPMCKDNNIVTISILEQWVNIVIIDVSKMNNRWQQGSYLYYYYNCKKMKFKHNLMQILKLFNVIGDNHARQKTIMFIDIRIKMTNKTKVQYDS